MALLQVKYGAQTNNLPSLTNGSMYVHTSTTGRTVGSQTIYDAALYFDLGTNRYQIQSAVANKVANSLKLQLNGTDFGGTYDGGAAVTWNIPLAADVAAGLISNAAQDIYGAKTFKTNAVIEGTLTSTGLLPAVTNTSDIGSSSVKWANVYATTFHGELDGNATTATTADKVKYKLTIEKNASTKKEYNGGAAVTITLADLIDGTIPLSYIPAAAMERIVAYGTQQEAETALTNGDIQPGDLVQLSDGVMYYVKDAVAPSTTPTLETFTAGVATSANKVANKLKLNLGSSANQTEYDGSAIVEWTVPLASGGTAGLVSTADQTFAGTKTFSDAVTFTSGFSTTADSTITGTLTSANIVPSANNTSNLGSANKKYANVYATTFTGNLSGSATSAGYVGNKLTFDPATTGLGGGSAKVEYNGSAAVTIGLFGGAANASSAGKPGLVPAPAAGDYGKFLCANGGWANVPSSTTITNGDGISVTAGTTTTYIVAHSAAGTATSSGGLSSDVTLGRASGQSASFGVPYVSYDAYGHVTGITNHTVTLGSITAVSGMTAANGATKIATILGTDIYSGIEWGTF